MSTGLGSHSSKGSDNLLLDEGMLCHIIGEASPERDSVWMDVEAGLDERDRSLLHIELVPGGERMIDAPDTEGLDS